MEMIAGGWVGLEVVNIILLSILIYIYSSNFLKLKSRFALGLLVFAVFLLLQNVIGVMFGFGESDHMRGPEHGYIFAINISETIALLTLFWISLE